MKYVLLFAFSLLFVVCCFGQGKAKPTDTGISVSKSRPDVEITLGPLTDSTALISVRDLRPLYQALKTMHEEQPEEYQALIKSLNNPLVKFLDGLIATRAEEYRKKNSKPKQN